MKKKFWGIVVGFVSISFLLGSTSLAEAKDPVTLKAITAWPDAYTSNDKFKEWVKLVNERGKGSVNVKIVGGPEAIPLNEQFGALRRGVCDILLTAAGYYMATVPESEAFGLSRLSPEEERERGFSQLMEEIHKEYGVAYLGRGMGLVPLGVLCTNKKVQRPQELDGQKIRTVIIYDAFMRELGAVPVTMPVPEIYTALQRGVVDGFVQPLAGGFVRLGFHEVVKYIVKHTFYQLPTVILGNQKTWSEMPADTRDFMIATLKEVEKTEVDYYRAIHNGELKQALEKGVELIEFSPEDAKWFVETAYRVSWENLTKKAPKNASRLKELSVK